MPTIPRKLSDKLVGKYTKPQVRLIVNEMLKPVSYSLSGKGMGVIRLLIPYFGTIRTHKNKKKRFSKATKRHKRRTKYKKRLSQKTVFTVDELMFG